MAEIHEVLIRQRVIPRGERGALEFLAKRATDEGEWILNYAALAVGCGHSKDLSARQIVRRLERKGILKRQPCFDESGRQRHSIVVLDFTRIVELYPENPLLAEMNEPVFTPHNAAIKIVQRGDLSFDRSVKRKICQMKDLSNERSVKRKICQMKDLSNERSGKTKGLAAAHDNERGRARLHYMDMELMDMDSNPGEKNLLEFLEFPLTPALRQWAKENCPQVGIELATENWKAFQQEKGQTEPLKNPIGSWKSFLKKRQKFNEEKAEARDQRRRDVHQAKGQVGAAPKTDSPKTTQAAVPSSAAPAAPEQSAPISEEQAVLAVETLASFGNYTEIRQMLAGEYPNLPLTDGWRQRAEELLRQREALEAR